ncbi:DoxX family protein [Pontibacter sp. G13]|uniref:DoxX family protein n=1 Tax=Pontibacter sp. G13 TaxID=3074898 RepID=UPI00288B262A|nr:DoxX family protein [Pontibacter sp. G13]WNJ20855.1 DoxX family protein [Pontibacter sp. G13]
MSTYQIIGILFAIMGTITCGSLAFEWSKRKTLDLDYLPITGILVFIIRWMVGILFIYSGFVKANDYIGFAFKLEEYFTVFGVNFPGLKGFFDLFIPLAQPMAWFIAVFEIALAVALMFGWQMNLTAWLTMLMMIFFTVLTGYSHVTGSVTDCGCFGDALHLEPWESFVKDIILTGALIPVFLMRKSIRPIPTAKIAGYLTGITFLVTGVYSYYCHEHLPRIDYRAYKIGVNLADCTTIPGPEGYPKCKDWDPYFPDGDIALFEGNTLMIFMYNAEKAPEEPVKHTEEVFQSLNGTGVKVVGATATGPSRMKTLIPEMGLTYPFAYLDQTTLKTVVRSNPGYVLLKQGIVIKKWHHNDAPSKTEILELLK